MTNGLLLFGSHSMPLLLLGDHFLIAHVVNDLACSGPSLGRLDMVHSHSGIKFLLPVLSSWL